MDTGTLARTRTPLSGPALGAIHLLSPNQKLRLCIMFAASELPSETGQQLAALADPRALAALAAMIGMSAAAQLTPFGWAADIAGFCLGAYALGSSVSQVAADLREFVTLLGAAECEPELRAAAHHLARAVAAIGAGTLLLWLTKRGARATLTTQQLASAAEKVALKTAGREVALWSGVDPQFIPSKYATLEWMLDESSPAGRTLHELLKARNDVAMDKDVWYALSERAAELGSESKKIVHYFVSEERGYIDALKRGKEVEKWWVSEGKAKLVNEITREAKSAAETQKRVSALDRWKQGEIEAHHYAEFRKVKRGDGRTYVEDEMFHKIEKLNLDRVLVHVIDKNGVEVGNPFWRDF